MKKISLTTLALLFVGGVFLFLTGCQTYSSKSSTLDQKYQAGKLPEAAKEADSLAKKNEKSKKDSIVYNLEQGAVLRAVAADEHLAPDAAQDFLKRSNVAFDRAEARVNEYEAAAKIKVGSETGAALTNLANLPYRGRAYDKIMLNTYKALNYMQLGDLEAARVELNRALQRQRDAVEENAKRIAANETDIANAKSGGATKGKGFDVEKTAGLLSNPDKQAKLNTAELDAVASANPYADYVNPFSVLLDGIFFSACAVDNDDMERARKSFERVAQMAPGNRFAKQDLADVTARTPPKGVTYVICENGLAPHREQDKFTLPISLVVVGPAPNIVIALPYLKFHNAKPAMPGIVVDGAETPPELVCNMDSVIARDFKNEWPTIVTKTIVSASVKAVIDVATQQAVKEATKNNQYGSLIQLGAKLGSLIANSATTIADTRQWRTLPKEFAYARIPTPASRALSIGGHTINLLPGDVNVVYVKNIAPSVPPLISQFTLKNRDARPTYALGSD